MPVEIRKIIIKAEVQAGDPETYESADSEFGGQINEQAIIRKCVQQVLKIIQKEKER